MSKELLLSTILQFVGGGFFLVNKVFFSIGERTRLKGESSHYQRWRVAAWICYIVGLAPWVIIFIWERNWIAASVETAGLPAMVVGLLIALRGGDLSKIPAWLNSLAKVFIPIGIVVSVWDFGGFSSFTQWLELGLVASYVIGTYQLAHENARGYLWFVLMHLCCGYLMWVQSYQWLTLQQVVSLVFIVDAYWISQRRRRQVKTVGVETR